MAKKKKAATKKAKAEATADTNGKFAETKPKQPAKKEKKPKEDLVVFAFRLKAEERDLIHEAAGPAKASKYVRALVLAASKGDEKSVVDIVRAVKSAS